jgi:mannosyltransferase
MQTAAHRRRMSATQSPSLLAARIGQVGGRRGSLLELAVPALLTLALGVWGIRGPSYWRDEAATISAVRRPLPALVQMLANVDAVHGAYYLIMWPVARLAGTGEFALRMPSVVAMSVTALVIVAIGRRTLPGKAGLVAGLVWALLPATSWYGQNARPYAMAATMACTASYLLLRVHESPERKWLRWYALSMAGLGAVNLFGLLLIPAHGITAGLSSRHYSGPGRLAHDLRRWLSAAGLAALSMAPLAVLAWRQRADIEWIPPLNHHQATTVAGWGGSLTVSQVIELIIVTGIAFAAAAGWTVLMDKFPGALLTLAVPWLVTPLALLVTTSLVKPVFEFRYILISAPAVALLGGAAISALGRTAGVAAVIILALTAVPGQQAVRSSQGRFENIRWLDQIIADHEPHGDAVLYSWSGWRQAAAAYPYGLAQLDDVAQDETPLQAGNLLGTERPAAEVNKRLRTVSRIWLVQMNISQADPLLAGRDFRLAQTWRVADVWLQLYTRPARN